MGNNSNNTAPDYVVGIDFGSAGIGYAYGHNPINPILSNLEGQVDNKVPNEIILDNDLNEILAFGNECSKYINSQQDNRENYQYFKDIKMNLYKKQYYIKSTNDKEVDIEKVIAKILEKISKEAIDHIKLNSTGNIDKNKIKWVVTIPAIWEEKSKQIMINSSKKAGLINENTDLSLFLALEPEVAGIFYFSDLNTKLNKEEKTKELLHPYILCDIGAGTVDICTLRKEKDKNRLIEEYPPLGGNYGGNYINKEFMDKIIIELFGKEKVEKAKNDPKFKEFEKNIETLKKDLQDNVYNCNLNCRLFKDENNSLDISIDNYIEKFNKKNQKYILKRDKKDEWELLFPNQILLDITKNIANKIFKKLEEVYNNVEKAQIIFTGAGSNNKILTEYIKNFFIEKNVSFDIKTTIQPEVSILKGAVIYGFQTNIIRKRKPKYTIGINYSQNWDDKYKNGGHKYYNKTEKKWKCRNLFKKFITRNEYINFDEVISHNFIALNSNLEIAFYKTLKKNCTFCDEKENNDLIIEKFGRVIIEIKDYDKNFRDVRIEMKMGGTYIIATAVYLKTGKKTKITQDFDEKSEAIIIEYN